ncbi:MAG TPA: TetR/AcrR family transcriptional regulator [Chloroflexia bacterium]|nr:TetR/AcrR family transcriptional regulator [Chloroflexia bacterium]
MARVAGSARQQILDVASKLFYQEGFRAVGIDTIIEQSGVAKMTLYRHFASKDDLIVAYLEQSNEGFWRWFDSAVAIYAEPRRQLYALFEALEKLVTNPTCLGCTFQGTAAEFPDRQHPGHAVALAHKQSVRERLRKMAAEAGAKEPETLAAQLLLLMDGAFVAARMYGPLNPENPARSVTKAAATLLDTFLPAENVTTPA